MENKNEKVFDKKLIITIITISIIVSIAMEIIFNAGYTIIFNNKHNDELNIDRSDYIESLYIDNITISRDNSLAVVLLSDGTVTHMNVSEYWDVGEEATQGIIKFGDKEYTWVKVGEKTYFKQE